jgi:hypothetical protein
VVGARDAMVSIGRIGGLCNAGKVADGQSTIQQP